jgi:hypothetical protein
LHHYGAFGCGILVHQSILVRTELIHANLGLDPKQ